MSSAISIWSGISVNQEDARTHFWYGSEQGRVRRLCDDLESVEEIQESDTSELSIPCQTCQELYVEDIAFGKRLLEHLPLDNTDQHIYSHDNIWHPLKTWGYPSQNEEVGIMECPPIGMATFARFYDAPASGKVRTVRDARTFAAAPGEYHHRSYYWALRNTLSQTHWKTNELSDFKYAITDMLAKLSTEHRKENYKKVGESYLNFWGRQEDAQFFKIPLGTIEIAGLNILINPEIGLRRSGDNLALKLWFSAPKPKRSYRQAIQYLMNEAQKRGWQRQLQPALWDVRREEILPPLPIARDFERAIRGQAAAFLEMWGSFDADQPIVE